ncbi:MAG: acyltransferase [Chloroflexi bacterium]|nr:acyltransferase [Chloroflexota bacterium]
MFRQMVRSIGSTIATSTKARGEAQHVTVPVVGQRILALDGLRGAAILSVGAFHLAQSIRYEFGYENSPILRAIVFGWTGVELFFVLSGFLITGVLYDSKQSQHYFRNFYMRRVLRLFPLYYGTLVIISVLRVVWPDAGVYGTESWTWLWLYLTNVVMALKGFGAVGLADHFWWVAVEQHFYLVWPLAVFLLNRRRLLHLSVAVFLVSAGVRLALVLGGVNPEAIYVLTPVRLDALSVGAFLALLVRRPERFGSSAKPAWVVACLSGLAIVAIVVVRHTVYHLEPVMQTLGYPLLAVFFGALLVLGVVSPLRRLFNLGVLRWFGKYSYGIYLWHPIVFMLVLHTDLARSIRGGSGTVEMLVSITLALGVVLAITLLSWRFWESQFLKLQRYFR